MRFIALTSLLALLASHALAQTPAAQYSADAIKERLSGVVVAPVPGVINPACQTYEARINDPKCAAALDTNEQLFPYKGAAAGTSKANPKPTVSGAIKRPPVRPQAKAPPRRGSKPATATVAANQAAASCVDQVGDEASGLNLCVTFASASATLTPQARANLDQFAKALVDPSLLALSFAVEGHADRKGNDVANKALSDQRAGAVMAYLVSKGVAAARMSAAGFGSERPVIGKDPADAANRRVEARIVR